jgi:DNA-binding NtrC family response regulator
VLVSRTVLVVDDDGDFAELVGNALEDADTTVLTFDDPLHALEALRKVHADVLISDLSMPWLDGKRLIEAARRLQPGLEVVLVSAFPRVAEIAARGGVRFLQKPVHMPELIEIAAH